MAEQNPGLPGLKSARTCTPRNVFLGGRGEYLPGGRVIDGTTSRDTSNTDTDVLQAGLIMGKITSGGQYSNSILGVTTNAEAVGSTSIQASAACVTELVRRVGSSGTFTLVGPPNAGGQVVSETVTYSAASGTDITVTATTNAFIAGSFIMPTDGSQVPVTFIADEYGVKVTDEDGSSIDVPFARLPIGGKVDSSQLINWPSDASLRLWLIARLNDGVGGKFTFDHGY